MAKKKKRTTKKRKSRRGAAGVNSLKTLKRKLRGYGLAKQKGKRKGGGGGGRLNKGGIKVDSKQLAGLRPMDGLQLYRSQLASGVSR